MPDTPAQPEATTDHLQDDSLPDEDTYIRTAPNQRVSSISLASIGELTELESEFDRIEVGGAPARFSISAERGKLSLEEVESMDPELLEANIRASLRSQATSSDISIDLDVIGGVRDSLRGKHAENATFKKDPAERLTSTGGSDGNPVPKADQ